MSIPVMTVVAAIRNELSITTRDAADKIGISSGFLQQAEEFEYVTTPDYRTAQGKPLEISIKQFFDDTLSLLKEPLSSVVKFTNPYVPEVLENDRTFHVIANSNALASIYVPVSGLPTYGPLFNFIISEFMERTSNGTFLKRTGDDVIDYFIDFIMSRFWGHRAVQRRRHARSAGFVYNTLLSDNQNTKHVGFFEGCKDPREILWLSPTYTSRRSFLPYLFLYLLTTRFNINFYLPDLNEKKSQCITPPKHTTGVLANYPTHCEVISPDECTSPFSTCNVITLFCPNNKLVDFCFRPENKGLFDNYCVRCVEKK